MGASMLQRLHAGDLVFVEIGAAAVVAVALAVLLVVVWRRRRRRREEFQATLATLVAEVQALSARIEAAPARVEPPPVLERVESELREERETMRELVGAIAEYGEHLRSHTAVMQGLAATTVELQRATAGLRLAVAPTPAAGPDPELLAMRGALRMRTLQIDELLAGLDREFGDPSR